MAKVLDIEPYFREVSVKWPVTKELLDAGDSERALHLIEDSIEEAGRLTTSQQWIIRGRCLYSLKRSAEALGSLERSIELDPTNAYAYSGRGATLIDLDCFTEALASLDCAIHYNPSDADTYYWRGIALYCLDRLHEALESFDRAIELNPMDNFAHHYKGYICYYTGIFAPTGRCTSKISLPIASADQSKKLIAGFFD